MLRQRKRQQSMGERLVGRRGWNKRGLTALEEVESLYRPVPDVVWAEAPAFGRYYDPMRRGFAITTNPANLRRASPAPSS